jgi:uncharacterized protein (TIGR02569 family)
VLEAFGVADAPEPLAGGQGETWRAGDIVLKPVGDPGVHDWVSEVQAGWTSAAVRVPDPVRAAGGAWRHEGWAAHRFVPGTTARAGDDPDRFRAGVEAFHAATAGLTAPAALVGRADPWARADRVAWEGAEPAGSDATVTLVRRATAALRPLDLPAQVVHGDLGGNMLWHDDLPPAVIDVSPYVRPAGWPLAVVAMDAVCWEGADPALLDRWGDVAEWDQLLLRAVVFRIATRGIGETLGWPEPDGDGYVAPGGGVDLVLDRIGAA